MTRKRGGIYYWRRRLPGCPRGAEVAISLGTRWFRQAEHLAALADEAFERALMTDSEGARGIVDPTPRGVRLDDPAAAASAAEAVRSELAPILALRRAVRDVVRQERAGCPFYVRIPAPLMRALGVPGSAEPTTTDKEASSTTAKEAVRPKEVAPAPAAAVPVEAASKPLFSALADKKGEKEAPFFEFRAAVKDATHQVMGQERGTLRRFKEVCGDRPVDAYGRADITVFINTMRKAPKTYGKSPKDRDRSLADIIKEADREGAERLADKTVKRHLSTLSQFFKWAMDQGYLTKTAWADMVEGHDFRTGRAARDQRDAWLPEELIRLFGSPVWTGCHPYFRAEQGPSILRDAKFWIPLLALYHGARLEEFADLKRGDVGQDEGTWFIRIEESEGRRLKNKNATRVIPLHPELVRLGFIRHVESTPEGTFRKPHDPLFPDLAPHGPDGKRGPRITKWFAEYRKAIGVYRKGVGMHAFRHTANTRLRDTMTTEQHRRHINHLLGHSQGGGEGEGRYDKGPGLRAVAGTLTLLRYPEINLSYLYVAV